MLNKKTIPFNGEEIEVEKIKVKDIAKLASVLKDLPELFKEFITDGEQEYDTQHMLDLAPSLIMQAGETLPQFLSVASGVELETIEDGGLDDLIVLIDAVLELNNFEMIFNYLKNLIATQGS